MADMTERHKDQLPAVRTMRYNKIPVQSINMDKNDKKVLKRIKMIKKY